MDAIRRIAVALKYDPKLNSAPKVVAKGRGYIANAIEKNAREHQITFFIEPGLAKALYTLEIDQEIPKELYIATARVLAYVYEQESKIRPKNKLGRK